MQELTLVEKIALIATVGLGIEEMGGDVEDVITDELTTKVEQFIEKHSIDDSDEKMREILKDLCKRLAREIEQQIVDCNAAPEGWAVAND